MEQIHKSADNASEKAKDNLHNLCNETAILGDPPRVSSEIPLPPLIVSQNNFATPKNVLTKLHVGQVVKLKARSLFIYRYSQNNRGKTNISDPRIKVFLKGFDQDIFHNFCIKPT